MELEVFSRRWDHPDSYSVERISTGWKIGHINVMMSGNCDKKGHPYLFENLDHDCINYPHDLGDYLEWLWDRAEEQGMSDDEIQKYLITLGKWIQEVEKSSPKEIWEDLK